jgi:hypothetical protein
MALCVFHDDHHPSLRGKGTRWRCWACGAGDYVEAGKSGSIIDLGARLWTIEPSGRGYFEIRRRLAEARLGAWGQRRGQHSAHIHQARWDKPGERR